METTQTEPTEGTGGVTIHHVDRDTFSSTRERRDFEHDVVYGEQTISIEVISDKYEPVETILETTDLDEAFHRAQGMVVTEQQRARHGVPSASPGDVFEVVNSSDRTFYLVEKTGFSEVA
jgi:hypothetical protein